MTQTEEQTAAAWGDYGGAAAWAPVVDALKQLDTRIAAVLRVNDSAIGQLRSCEWEMSGYPHPGCAEFGPPDVFTCSNVATHRAVWRYDLRMLGDPAESCEFPGDEHPEIGVTLSCAEHVHDMICDPYPADELVSCEVIDTGERVTLPLVAHRPAVYSEEQHCDTCGTPVVHDEHTDEFVHAEAQS